MRKIKAFSLLLFVATVMLFAGSISENHLSVNAQTTKQTHHKKKHVKKAKKQTKVKHKKTTKKKKAVKKHPKKTTKAKSKHQKKSKKATKAKKKVATHKKTKKKATKKIVKKTNKKKKVVKKKTKPYSSGPELVDDNPTTKENEYDSIDGFNFDSEDYATKNPIDTLNIPSNYMYGFNNDKKIVERTRDINDADPNSISESRKINVFHPKIADTKRLVDINRIDTNLQRELSQYAADLINQFRLKLSNNYLFTQPLTVTDTALKASREVADGYNNDNWSMTKKGHDNRVLSNVANKYSLNYYAENMTESLLTDSYVQNPINLANVKESIYGGICAMMFDDASSSWGHSDIFLSVNLSKTLPEQFGVSIDKMGQIHFEIYYG